MRLEQLIPMITVRFVAVDAVYSDGERGRLNLDTGKRNERGRLYRFARWRVESLQAAVRQYGDGLWPILVITVIEPKADSGDENAST